MCGESEASVIMLREKCKSGSRKLEVGKQLRLQSPLSRQVPVPTPCPAV